MTTNQIQYWNLRESARHNRVVEEQGAFQIQEQQRHNVVTEQQGWQSLNLTERQINESVRHNLVTEDQGQQSINESVRHNRAQETIGFGQIRATVAAASISAAAQRYAADTNAATQRYGTDVQAFIGMREAGIHQQQADAAMWQANAAQRQQDYNEQMAPSQQIGAILGGGAQAYGSVSSAQNASRANDLRAAGL